jgi:hypothetical protein
VPKYDAFGREIGEDTLQGLGGSPAEGTDWREEAYAEPPQPEPQPVEDEAQRRELAGQLSNVLQQATRNRGVPPTVTVRRSGTMRGCLITVIVVLIIGGIALAAIGSLVSSIDIDTGGIEEAIKAPATSEPPPKGFEGESLARPAALGAALTKIRTQGGGKLTNLRVAPERIDATLLTPAGALRHVQVKPGGGMERFGSDSGTGFDSVPTINYEKLRPAAVERLARRGAEEHGIPVSEFQYAVPQDIGGKVRWVVYFTRARYVIGDARGRFERAYP